MRREIPFVGRAKEAALLRKLHAAGKHVIVLGPRGVGKTELISRQKYGLRLAVCSRSECLSEVLGGLEGELGIKSTNLRLADRKQRLLRALARCDRTVVFDGVGWVSPKLASFFECVMERVPIWICARSEHAWEIGHFWRLLVRFQRIELHAFRPAETRAFVSNAVESELIPRDAVSTVNWLHHRSKGNPGVLGAFCEVLASGSYDLANSNALRRLDLDRRIRENFPLIESHFDAGRDDD